MFNVVDKEDREGRALYTLAQISNQNTNRRDQWEEKKKRKKDNYSSNKRHKIYLNSENAKSQKLPLILSKSNLGQDYHSFIKFNHKVSSYILIEKGLGPYGTLSMKHKKVNLRYFDQNSKLAKIPSQFTSQDISAVKGGLNIKKQNYKSHKSLLSKGKKYPLNREGQCFLSIKNIL